MKKITLFTLGFLILILRQTSALSIEEWGYRGEIELYDSAGNVRVVDGYDERKVLFSEAGFKITSVTTPRYLGCDIEVFCGYDQTGRFQTYRMEADSYSGLPIAARSITLSCFIMNMEWQEINNTFYIFPQL